MVSKPYSPTRNPIARAIHYIVIAAIVITVAMWISDYIHTWIDFAARERQRTEQPAASRRTSYIMPITCQRPGSGQ